MTFYNIIFGILFLGACREILSALVQLSAEPSPFHQHLWMATTIALLIFNDAVYTSHLLEERRPGGPRSYSLSMKLIDLVNFLLLGTAMVVLNPAKNFLDVNATAIFGSANHEGLFWAILTLYWGMALAWNLYAQAYSPIRNRWMRMVPNLMLVPFAAMTVVSARATDAALVEGARRLTCACFALYLLAYKTNLDRMLKNNAA